MLKSRLLGEISADIDRLLRAYQQFGGPARQAAASAASRWRCGTRRQGFGVPVYQMLAANSATAYGLLHTDVSGRDTAPPGPP
jgi:hypothetical protein